MLSFRSFFFSSLSTYTSQGHYLEKTGMWVRRFYRLLPSFRNYSCKIELRRNPPYEPNMLWINQFRKFQPASGGLGTETYCPSLHNSLLEQCHVSIARISWFRPENLKLPAESELKEEPPLIPEGEMNKLCSSVLKKRRSKMNKHKYKKRRKKYKFLRRALGK